MYEERQRDRVPDDVEVVSSEGISRNSVEAQIPHA